MGFRFSKRITILPGVRLNLSKSGVSLSAGPKGASVTVGKRGVYGNVGIPGTGLSYRERLDKPRGQEQRQTAQLPEQISVKMVGDQAVFYGPDNIPLPQALLPAAKRMAKDQVKAFLQEHADQRNQPVYALQILHHDAGSIETTAPLLSGKPQEHNYHNRQTYMAALMAWRAAQSNHGWNIGESVVGRLSTLSWPLEPDIIVAVDDAHVSIDIKLPGIDALPSSVWKAQQTSLSLVQQDLTQKDRAGIFLDFVCSSIVRLIAHTMGASAQISRVSVSASTTRNSSSGRPEAECIATVVVTRSAWKEIDLNSINEIDPHNLLRRLSAKMDVDRRGHLLVQRPLN